MSFAREKINFFKLYNMYFSLIRTNKLKKVIEAIKLNKSSFPIT